jgi:hypothetical protein
VKKVMSHPNFFLTQWYLEKCWIVQKVLKKCLLSFKRTRWRLKKCRTM